MQTAVSRYFERTTRGLVRRIPPTGRKYIADTISHYFEEITYLRLREAGFRPDGIIDVGAFEGNWTRLTRSAFGPVPTLMAEAQPGKRGKLDAVVADHPEVRIAMAPLSGNSGDTVTFYEMGTGSSLLPERSDVGRNEHILITRTLDEVAEEALPDCSRLFLKIDVQGAELQVLAGGAKTLQRAEIVQLECALLQYNSGAPLLPEVVTYMAERGFYPIEVSGFSRPRDRLVQIDLLFANEGSQWRPDTFQF